MVAKGDTIYAGCQDGYVKVVDLETKTLIRTIIVEEVTITSSWPVYIALRTILGSRCALDLTVGQRHVHLCCQWLGEGKPSISDTNNHLS
jgi:hypothetical protein